MQVAASLGDALLGEDADGQAVRRAARVARGVADVELGGQVELVREAQLPPLRVGDVIALGRCGAYSVTEGVAVFLSRDMPRVALYRDGDFTLVRDRFATDVLNTCQTLEDGT